MAVVHAVRQQDHPAQRGGARDGVSHCFVGDGGVRGGWRWLVSRGVDGPWIHASRCVLRTAHERGVERVRDALHNVVAQEGGEREGVEHVRKGLSCRGIDSTCM